MYFDHGGEDTADQEMRSFGIISHTSHVEVTLSLDVQDSILVPKYFMSSLTLSLFQNPYSNKDLVHYELEQVESKATET